MNTSTPFDNTSIGAAIEYLYEESEAIRPTAKRCIVPLKKLITGCPLNCVEMTDLTREVAIAYFSEPEGVRDKFDHEDGDILSGFLYTSSRSGTIFINRSEPVVRRRFSIAHEIGHFLLHLRPLFKVLKTEGTLVGISDAAPENESGTDADDSTERLGGRADFVGEIETAALLPPLEEMESQADKFATELLMPVPIIQELFALNCVKFREKDLAWRLATEMLVSHAAMDRRLKDLKLISYK
jgi:Zn-dependent peptidase ImmA (M78 family)